MYAQGNNLQIGVVLWGVPMGEEMGVEALFNNNAPNVSDVVYLQSGEKIEIHVWQNFSPAAGAGIRIGTAKTYASIHKVS